MGKFNWWRRQRSHKPLMRKQLKNGDSFVIQKIKHKDFSISPFYESMQYEMQLGHQLEAEIIATNISHEAKQVKIARIWQGQMKRYNKLAEDFMMDEHKRLESLRLMLLEEFKSDHWEAAVEKCEGNEMDLYKIYAKLATKKKKK